jgi:hypothetical protein
MDVPRLEASNRIETSIQQIQAYQQQVNDARNMELIRRGGYNGYSGMQTNQELYSVCMKARGYSWQPDKVTGQ